MVQYFAEKDGVELLRILNERVETYRRGLDDSGQWDRWQKMYDRYYGNHFKKASKRAGTEIYQMGDNGHLSGFAVNHFRNLIKHLLVMTTSQKPSFDCRAINSDLKSLQQARLGNNILDAYLREKRLNRYMHLAAEQGLVFNRGHVEVAWEPSLGRPYGRKPVTDENGQPVIDEKTGEQLTKVVYEGDVDISNPYPWQVITDEIETDWNKTNWRAVVCLKNKFDLSARYPHLREKILAIPPISEDDIARWYMLNESNVSKETSDSLIEVIKFYHKKTEYMPNGRYMLGAGHDVVMYDDALPYDDIGVFRIVPGEKIGTTEGYTDANDLIGPQDAYNVIMSTIFSNVQTLGLNIVQTPEGSNISDEMISKGLVMIKTPAGGEVKAVNLATIPEVLFKVCEVIEKVMETTSGVNSVSRGNPDYDMSGIAMSLLQSMTAQYASAFEQSWGELYEDVGTFMLGLLKKFANTKRLVAMAGKHNRNAMTSFTGKDLEAIERVVVDLGNPIGRTTAGKLQIADTLISNGKINTPQEYFQVLQTGNLEPLIQGPQAQIDRIRSENEALMEGKQVQALISDSHLLDAQEHRQVIDDPLIRERAAQGDPLAVQIVQNTLAHIQEHKNLYYQAQDPFWSIIAGEPPAPPPPPAPPMGPPPQDAPQDPAQAPVPPLPV